MPLSEQVSQTRCRMWQCRVLAKKTPSETERDRIANAIGRPVRRLRQDRGMSQERFAEESGYHRTYIGFLERGERMPNALTLYKVARALGMSLSALLLEADL